ncbi:hypothetical protein [Clostridium estertheticum]|uniref:Uncharacterized protein n=1 Tax=Clostridium estertheticum TaxID=238834 RepID=A0A7Y3SV92_9CLOT|nr:hypothetical protein [Clostridium estertheticum]NNU75968.1 hypothetical protein [Clostridium estertheticum]WBL46643.1 hypothetical protein LOR37_18565 [Clostridium estertheticum]
MGKIIEWKKEEANNKVIEDIEEDSLLVIHQFVKTYYEEEKQGEIHPYEINGFEVGLISYLNLLEKGLLPNIIKNINVLAVNKFDRLSKLFPEVDIPQEFYIGFLKGFCSIYDKYI